MNAPTIWIIVPAFIAVLLLPIRNQRSLSIIGGVVVILLAVTAQFIPIEEAFRLGALSIKIDSSLAVFGRVLQIKPAEGSLLAIIYGATALWFFGAEASKTATRLVPYGLLITTFMSQPLQWNRSCLRRCLLNSQCCYQFPCSPRSIDRPDAASSAF